MEPPIRNERTTCGLRISDSPTSDNLIPQETTLTMGLVWMTAMHKFAYLLRDSAFLFREQAPHGKSSGQRGPSRFRG